MTRRFETEPTAYGEQALVSGVAPITAADRLRILAHAPLTPKHQQKPLDIGLFDELGRSQLDFFDCSTGRRDPAPSAGAIPHPNKDEEKTK